VNILVTNDDGIESAGIKALGAAMQQFGTVYVVAPDRQQSAVGHALTVASPLRATPIIRHGIAAGWAIDGTPADCVKLAISALLPEPPSLVISGINHGNNASVNAIYSGTVSAATEGALMGIPAIAVSVDSWSESASMELACSVAATMVQQLPLLGVPKGTLLNINVPNIPANQCKGIKMCRQGNSVWSDSYQKRTDPHGREYFWLQGELTTVEDVPDADDVAVREGWASVTPLHYELTNMDVYNALRAMPPIAIRQPNHQS
jgi:5'-nucleotidase